MPRRSSHRHQPEDVFRFINMHDGDTSVCWEWLGSTRGKDPRPKFNLQGKQVTAYRLVYTLVNGPLDDKELVRHTCDNRMCCNPTHLIKGTHKENMQDMKDRDRHGQSAHVIRSWRKLADDGITHAQIAKRFGVGRSTVTEALSGVTHGHVSDDEGAHEDDA